MSEQQELLFSRVGDGTKQFGVIGLNRPQALNALNASMIETLNTQLEAWAQDDQVGAVLVKSHCDRAFCAGGDIRDLYHRRAQGVHANARFFKAEYALNQRIFHYPKPYVVLMDGITMGGGVGISVHGSHRVVTERCQWAMPETKIGFFPDVGVSYHLARCPEMVGYYLALSGRSIPAACANEFGLADAVVDASHLGELEQALYATELCGDVNAVLSDVISHFMTPSVSLLAEYYPKIRRCFSMCSVAEIIEALALEGDDWSDALIAELNERSPTSLAVTFAQLNRAINFELNEVIQQDTVLANHFLQQPDLFEGVRALLIDKDGQPKWTPSTLTAVQPERVEDYFNAASMVA